MLPQPLAQKIAQQAEALHRTAKTSENIKQAQSAMQTNTRWRIEAARTVEEGMPSAQDI
jgi:hypothetical protein